jgi:hypothetical protein
MAAKDHVNPQQLKLFYTAGELMNMEAGDSEDAGSLSSDTELRDVKLTESLTDKHRVFDDPAYDKATGESLYESIQKHGVKKPVTIGIDDNGTWVSNGHHRIVSANQVNPDMYVPHEYYDHKQALADLEALRRKLWKGQEGNASSGTF